MPKVVYEDGMAIMVYVRDEHPPAHVHVAGSDWEVRVLIGAAAVYWDVSFGRPNNKQIQRAEELTAKYLATCNATWEIYHG